MIRIAAILMIVLGVTHLLVLGADIPGEMRRWASLNLWTFDHWQPLRSQQTDLALSNGVFWSTIGSFAIPMILLGWMFLIAEKRGWVVPPALGWALVGWTFISSAIMLHSGFPVAVAVMLLLAIGLQRRWRGAGC